MARLIQLPNGSWIDPRTIQDVTALPGGIVTGCEARNAPRVVVVSQGRQYRVIDCESYDDAETLRDRIAAAANGKGWED